MSTGRKVAVITGASQGIRAALVKVGETPPAAAAKP